MAQYQQQRQQNFPLSHQLGGRAFNHSNSTESEQEYDRLRTLARQEHDKRSSCFDRAHQAYERGDGQAAHALSEEGKRHGAMVDQYNKQASDYIFRENNAEGRVDSDTIDLHGQFVEEAEDILEARIKYAQQHGQTHLHVIVGKGNHSRDHIQKIKPRVEQVCQQLGLDYKTEPNAGRMYINLTGAPAVIPEFRPSGGQHHQQGQGQGGQHYGGGQQQYQQGQAQQQYYGGQGQQQNQDNNHEQEIRMATRIVKRLLRGCCTVM